MKTGSTRWTCWGLMAGLLGIAGCAGGALTKSAQQPAGYAPSSKKAGSFDASYGPAPATAAAAPEMSSAPPSATTLGSPRRGMHESRSEPAPSAADRPGLGTEWGETRYSQVHNVSFDRADEDHPSEVVSLYYNDREGARAMARYGDYREIGDATVRSPGLGITVSLSDGGGRPLPAFFAGGHTYAIGEAGERYTIVVSNQTGLRIEAVASVDGLDVLDGKAADFGKRGYLVPAWGSVAIDGFRQSDAHVAAFRFGSVRDSYAARTGTDRNVGVIGVALFAPRGASRWPWTDREIERRKNADPFPGSYASPPPPRW